MLWVALIVQLDLGTELVKGKDLTLRAVLGPLGLRVGCVWREMVDKVDSSGLHVIRKSTTDEAVGVEQLRNVEASEERCELESTVQM